MGGATRQLQSEIASIGGVACQGRELGQLDAKRKFGLDRSGNERKIGWGRENRRHTSGKRTYIVATQFACRHVLHLEFDDPERAKLGIARVSAGARKRVPDAG